MENQSNDQLINSAVGTSTGIVCAHEDYHPNNHRDRIEINLSEIDRMRAIITTSAFHPRGGGGKFDYEVDDDAVSDGEKDLGSLLSIISRHDEVVKPSNLWMASEVKSTSLIGKVVRLRVMVKEFVGPNTVRHSSAESDLGQVDAAALKGVDDEANAIWIAPLIRRDHLDIFQTTENQMSWWTVYGMVYSRHGQFVIFPIHFERSKNILDRLSPRLLKLNPGEAFREAQRILTGIDRDPIRALTTLYCQQRSVANPDSIPEIMDAMDFVALGAHASAQREEDGGNGMQHLLLGGSPGTGKGMVCGMAAAILPIFENMQVGRMTGAGLAGATISDWGRFIATPRYLARNSCGYVYAQDFHTLKGSKRDEVFAVLSPQMEDGSVVISTAAGKTFKACTGVILDQNYTSQVDPEQLSEAAFSGQSKLKDIGMPWNILTRFTGIIEVPSDAERQLNTALKLVQQGSRSFDPHVFDVIKVYIAYVVDRIPTVEIPFSVGNYAQEKVKLLLEESGLAERAANSMIADFWTRMSVGIRVLIRSHARANMRSTAVNDDVDGILKYVRRKFEFIASIDPSAPAAPRPANTWENKATIMGLIKKHFEGEKVTPKEVGDWLETQGFNVNSSTLSRYLTAICGREAYGSYFVPGGMIRDAD